MGGRGNSSGGARFMLKFAASGKASRLGALAVSEDTVRAAGRCSSIDKR